MIFFSEKNYMTEFEHFLQKYWKVPRGAVDQPSDVELTKLKRGFWYCNLSGMPMETLDDFNFSAIQKDKVDDNDDNEDDNESPSLIDEFRESDYDLFTIFPCGHCFYDIYVYAGIYNYLNSNYISARKIKRNTRRHSICRKPTRCLVQILSVVFTFKI